MNTDQLMMLAYLADYMGQRMSPDPQQNPLGGFAQNYVQTRQLAQLLGGGKAAAPEGTPAPAPGALEGSPQMPDFTIGGGGGYLPPPVGLPEVPGGGRGYLPEVTPPAEMAGASQGMSPEFMRLALLQGTKASIDEQDNLTLKLPSSMVMDQGGRRQTPVSPTKPQEPSPRPKPKFDMGIYNPFRVLG